MALAVPGQKVRGSTSGRPIMAAMDLLGRRWSLRILWELRQVPLPFRELQRACGDLSPSTLNLRLKDLRAAGLVTLDEPAGYRLTELGDDLITALRPLRDWSDRWAKHVGMERAGVGG